MAKRVNKRDNLYIIYHDSVPFRYEQCHFWEINYKPKSGSIKERWRYEEAVLINWKLKLHLPSLVWIEKNNFSLYWSSNRELGEKRSEVKKWKKKKKKKCEGSVWRWILQRVLSRPRSEDPALPRSERMAVDRHLSKGGVRMQIVWALRLSSVTGPWKTPSLSFRILDSLGYSTRTNPNHW